MKTIKKLYNPEYIKQEHFRAYIPEILSLNDEQAFITGYKEGLLTISEELRKIREEYIEHFNRYYDKKLNQNIQNRDLGAIFLIDNLLNESSEDKLHCCFVVLD